MIGLLTLILRARPPAPLFVPSQSPAFQGKDGECRQRAETPAPAGGGRWGVNLAALFLVTFPFSW